jgi:hypothetical protein
VTILVFSPLKRGDRALQNARWIARQNVLALQRARTSIRKLFGKTATRSDLENSVKGVDGLVACSHGRSDAIVDQHDAPAVDASNASKLTGRWVHAIACRTAFVDGTSGCLAQTAVESGIACYAGYETKIIVEWDPRRAPPKIRRLLATLVSTATMQLQAGVRDEAEIRRAVQRIADQILLEADDLDGSERSDAQGCDISAQQFARRLRVTRP